MDHIVTLRILIDQEALVCQCLHSCFANFKKTFNTVSHDKLWEHLQQLGMPIHSQQFVEAIYTTIYAKIRIDRDPHGKKCPLLVLNKDAPLPVYYLAYTLMNLEHIWTRFNEIFVYI